LSKRKASPDEARRIATYAVEYLPCTTCIAPSGHPRTRPGPGRSVHKGRFAEAAVTLSQRDKETRRTPEQAAILARLPLPTEAEIEAGRSPRGGWTREQLAKWGVPWPPPAGWRQALLRGADGTATEKRTTTS
jgi:hypothetical protein